MGRKGSEWLGGWKEEEEEDGLNTGHKTFSSLLARDVTGPGEKPAALCASAQRIDHRSRPVSST